MWVTTGQARFVLLFFLGFGILLTSRFGLLVPEAGLWGPLIDVFQLAETENAPQELFETTNPFITGFDRPDADGIRQTVTGMDIVYIFILFLINAVAVYVSAGNAAWFHYSEPGYRMAEGRYNRLWRRMDSRRYELLDSVLRNQSAIGDFKIRAVDHEAVLKEAENLLTEVGKHEKSFDVQSVFGRIVDHTNEHVTEYRLVLVEQFRRLRAWEDTKDVVFFTVSTTAGLDIPPPAPVF